MPSNLDFEQSRNGNSIPDSKKGFRDFLLAKTLKNPNGPQSFTKDNYIEQNTSDFPNKNVGGLEKSENFDLIYSLKDTQNSNTYKPLEFLVKDTLNVLPRRANLNLYPYFVTSKNTLISILSTNNFNGESELFKFAADYIKNDVNGPIKARLASNLDTQTNGKIRLLDALNGNTATAINIITGREQLIEQNNSITVAKTLLGKGVDFLEKVAGVTAPFSEIPGDYLSNPSNPINYRPTPSTQKGALWQDLTGALGSLIGVQRRPKKDRKPSDLMIEYLGSGQKARLYDSLSFNLYSPNYTTTAMSQNTSKVFNFVDRVSQGIKKFLGEEAPSGGAYIGDDRGTDVKYAMSDFNDIQYKSSYYLSQMFDQASADIFHNNKDIVWSNKGGITDSSKDKKFRTNSILDKTQTILNLSPDGGLGLDHISNVINQTTKSFEDGKVRMSKGSAVKILVDKNSNPVGAEYGRAWTKVDTYGSLDKTMRRTANVRKFDGSVMGGKSRPWNLNMAPMSNGEKSFEGSTNIFERTKGTGDFYAKKYMFSIENLAWKTSTMPGFTVDSLPACERGNNGGRVMWFPPYDLKMSEQNNAKWETNSFLGRPEPIYTYQNTERTGQVSFKVVVDHPSILNLLVREHFKGMSDDVADEHINAFFAGTENFDFYELVKTYTTLDKNDIELIKQYLNAGKSKDSIKPYKYTSIPVAGNNPTPVTTANDAIKKDITVNLLFPNDRPAKNSNDGVQTNEEYGSVYSGYITKADTYVSDLDSELRLLLTGTSANTQSFKEDRKTIFGSEVQPADYETSITNRKKSVSDGFTKLTKDYTTYSGDMTSLKTEFKKNTVNEVIFTVVTSTSEVASDDYNFYLSIRRAHSIVMDIFTKLSFDGTTKPKLKWPTKDVVKGLVKSGTQFIVESYPLADFGYKENKGKINIIFKAYGENTPDKSCKQVIKTTIGLKDHAPIAFACRQGSLKYQYQVNNLPTETVKPKEDKQLSKIKVTTDDTTKVTNPKPPIDVMKRIIMKTLAECYYFKKLEDTDPFVFKSLKEKLRYFHPGFHSTTPEGLNSRLTFLLQCVRPGDTLPIKGLSDENDKNARNTSFGPPPICILRIGDFYHSKIIIKDVNITYDDGVWDLNPEGIGIQPMIANVALQIAFIGGQGLEKPVERLQNALSSNFFGNTEMYDERSISTNEFIDGKKSSDFTKEFLEDLQKRANLDLDTKSGEPNANLKLGEYIGSIKGSDLTYTKFVEDLATNTQSYLSSYQDAYNVINKKYGDVILPLLMSPNFRTISGCTVQTTTTPETLKLFGEYPKGGDVTVIYGKLNTKINEVINAADMNSIFKFDFIQSYLKDISNQYLRTFCINLVKEKLEPISTLPCLKTLQKSRINLVSTIDKLNYILQYGNDGQINGVTYTAAKLSGFTKTDFYYEYVDVIEYIKTSHVKMDSYIPSVTQTNYDNFNSTQLDYLLRILMIDQVKNVVDLYSSLDEFKEDGSKISNLLVDDLNKALNDYIGKPEDKIFALDKFPVRKNDKPITFTIDGTPTEIVEPTTGNKEELRKIKRDKNNLGDTLNFYKI